MINKMKNDPKPLEIMDPREENVSAETPVLKIALLKVGVKPGSVWWNPMAWVDIEGEFSAPQNNEVLLKFKTTRSSSVQGVVGGSVFKDLDEEGQRLVITAIEKDFKEMGDDLNELIFSFN